ncbi:MAG: MoaD/ThiS family protein [Candidatus Firestonebacteria bacterium]
MVNVNPTSSGGTRVNIKLYASLKNIFKKDSFFTKVSSINESILKLEELSNKKLDKNTFFIVINGQVITNYKDYQLKENDTLHIFPVIAGG